jgi:hypothetical protein
VKELPKLRLKSGDVVAFDRGYADFKQFAKYCDGGIYFIPIESTMIQPPFPQTQKASIGEFLLNQCARSGGTHPLESHVSRNGEVCIVLAGDDGTCAVPTEVMKRLGTFVTESTKRVLSDGEHERTFSTVRDSDRLCVCVSVLLRSRFPAKQHSSLLPSGTSLGPIPSLESPPRHTDGAAAYRGCVTIKNSHTGVWSGNLGPRLSKDSGDSGILR